MRACAAFLTGVEGLLNVNQVAKNTLVLTKIERKTLFLNQLLLSTQFIKPNRALALSNTKS